MTNIVNPDIFILKPVYVHSYFLYPKPWMDETLRLKYQAHTILSAFSIFSGIYMCWRDYLLRSPVTWRNEKYSQATAIPQSSDGTKATQFTRETLCFSVHTKSPFITSQSFAGVCLTITCETAHLEGWIAADSLAVKFGSFLKVSKLKNYLQWSILNLKKRFYKYLRSRMNHQNSEFVIKKRWHIKWNINEQSDTVEHTYRYNILAWKVWKTNYSKWIQVVFITKNCRAIETNGFG